MTDRTNPRSKAYQHLFTELSFDDNILEKLEHRLTPGLDQAILEAQDELNAEYINLIKTTNKLTDRQRQMILLLLQGYSQVETAKQLGTLQTTVHKTIYGNPVAGKPGRVYGGAYKKLALAANNNEKITALRKKIQRLIDNDLSDTENI